MPFASLPDIELYYESHGEGPVVTFLHGAGGNHISWWQQVPHFSRKYRCLTIDHRGFGRSVDVERRGSTRYVEDLLGLLDQLPKGDKGRINFQMKMALDKIAFLPFGLLIDKWRWVFPYQLDPSAASWDLRDFVTFDSAEEALKSSGYFNLGEE